MIQRIAGSLTAFLVIACLAILLANHARAQGRGPETNLPLPRFVSLKTSEGNARRGPSLSHRIDWVFTRKHMPLEIIAEYGHWRRVRDRDGMGGWVHYSLLSGARTAIVTQELLPMRSRPTQRAPETARLENGLVLRIDRCEDDWCRVIARDEAAAHKGWVRQEALWGVKPHELVE